MRCNNKYTLCANTGWIRPLSCLLKFPGSCVLQAIVLIFFCKHLLSKVPSFSYNGLAFFFRLLLGISCYLEKQLFKDIEEGIQFSVSKCRGKFLLVCLKVGNQFGAESNFFTTNIVLSPYSLAGFCIFCEMLVAKLWHSFASCAPGSRNRCDFSFI